MAAADPDFKPLYRAGAWAAIAVLALVPFQMAVFFAWPPPQTVTGWFALFERHPFVGLVDLDLFMIVDDVLLAVTFLAMCVALWRARPSWISIALMFELLAIAAYFASNPAFEMLALSRHHAAAASIESRQSALAAGEAMIASWQGSAFNISYVLSALAILIASGVMLRSGVFGRATAWTGLAFGALSLIPASAGTIGLVFSLASLVPMWAWFALVAARLLRLGAPLSLRAATGTTQARGERFRRRSSFWDRRTGRAPR